MLFQKRFQDSVKITWKITDKCNFQCDYCKVWKLNYKNEKSLPLQEYERIFHEIGKDWIFIITGGETFLKKDFISICKSITQFHYISISTNLSTSNVYEFADQIDPNKVVFVSCSTHIHEREKRDPDLTEFIKKINYLQDKKFNVIATFVAYPNLFSRLEKDFKKLKAGGVKRVQMKAFRGFYNNKYYPDSYTSEEIKFLDSLNLDYPEMEILDGQYEFYGMNCNAGTNSFVMDKDGNLRRCGGVRKRYGNLFDGTYTFDRSPKPCPLRKCSCPYEGIRNATSIKSSSLNLYNEIFQQGYLQSARVIQNPKLALKVIRKLFYKAF